MRKEQIINIYFIVGYFGSGKSEFCVNFAIQKNFDYLCDLDVINPYFRSRQTIDILTQHQIKVVSSIEPEARYLDMPLLSEEIFELYKNNRKVIYDLGGSTAGAKLIKQFEEYEKQPYALLFIINVFRPETNNVQKIVTEMQNIEESSGLKITGLINNSNLLSQTTEADLISGQSIIQEVVKITKVPLLYTSYIKDLKTHQKFDGEAIILNKYLAKHT
ncbi:MAG: hypothetical protein LBT17_03085 [Mycoplasmataceae bacterium]|jgi:hypothetical protein|nr:hypothetical protein [Mycoplasmataceae bacterium]